MLLPYASDHRPTRRPVVTWTLLLINLALTTIVVLNMHTRRATPGPDLLGGFGIVPARFNVLTLLTYTFFHESFGHLLINLFYLWVFGASVEEAVGRGKFFLLYIGGGAVGGLMQWLVTLTLLPPGSAQVPIVGASAACSALVGLFAVRYYRARLSFIGLPIRPHVVTVVCLFLAVEIGLGCWYAATGAAASGVAHWAHVGGFVFGLVCAQIMRLDAQGQHAYLKEDAAQDLERTDAGAGLAIRRWETLLAREPENVAARTELARAWQLFGDTEQAMIHYTTAIQTALKRGQRPLAARLYVETWKIGNREKGIGNRDQGLEAIQNPKSKAQNSPTLSPSELFLLGNTLEERKEFAVAAEAFRAVTVRNPDLPEAETALLKVIDLYIHHLDRQEEGDILARLFLERYPRSQWRGQVEDIRRADRKESPPAESN